MSKVTYDGQDFDMEDLRRGMDRDLVADLDKDSNTDQDFFDSYLIAHEKKYGEKFSVS
ncbi:MAG: hypothetical protein M3Y93_04990 [Pseudomonadota bacterium]|nr:hypothetical protein [Pseudomonadota bacterium]